MEQQKAEEKEVRRFYVKNILRNHFGMKSNLSSILSDFIIDFYEKFFNDFDYEKVKHIRNAQSNLCIGSAKSDKIYKIIFIVALMDKDTLEYKYSNEQALNKVIETVGDCTINECVGCFKNRQMRTFKIVKLIKEDIPKNYVHNKAKELKNIFNQESVITEVVESYRIDFNEYTVEYENDINKLMKEYEADWDKAVMMYNSGLFL